jgi:sortase A
MSGDPSLDNLSIEELEEILQARRRARALKRFRRVADGDTRERSASLEGSDSTGADRDKVGVSDASERKPQAGLVPASATRAMSSENATPRAEASFKAVKIVPESSAVGGVSSLVSRANKRLWRKGVSRLRDRMLLLLELAALAGLIFVVVSSLSELHVLNREVAEALETEHRTTPAVSPVTVLPGGSLPPASEGAVPGQLRHLVQPGASIPIPSPGPQQASRIVIPAINVDAPVVQGDGWEELKMGAGQRLGTANPGERGNVVISGHNDVYGEIFRYLEDLNIGEEVTIYAGDTPHKYLVVAKMVVQPTEVSLLEPTPNATLTLITCHPYMIDTHRLVVVSELVNQ